VPIAELMRLIGAIATRCGTGVEFTVEVNPGQVNAASLAELRRRGVNRLSLGAQSFAAAELKTLGRPYAPATIDQALDAARQAGFANISLDLIFAVPGSSLASWRTSLQAAIDRGVEHLSAYSLSFEEGTPFAARRDAGQLAAVDEETDRAMYELAMDLLAAAGYGQYEISNFARPGYECRHNLIYWANDPYVGIGPAAASCYHGERRTNVADVGAYLAALEAGRSPVAERVTPSPLEYACETAVLNLRRTAGIDLGEYRRRTGYDAAALFAGAVARYRDLGLLALEEGHLRLTRAALPIADSVLVDFADAQG
jgi:oxygen-independent coproporphyrinogen-3 oxidase